MLAICAPVVHQAEANWLCERAKVRRSRYHRSASLCGVCHCGVGSSEATTDKERPGNGSLIGYSIGLKWNLVTRVEFTH